MDDRIKPFANLRGANLRGANKNRCAGLKNVVIGGIRSDGYEFMYSKAYSPDGPPRVIAGCRNFTMQEARAHWEATRKDTSLGDETFAILDYMEAVAKIRGF